MRSLYAVQFEVAHMDGTVPATLGAEVLERVSGWIRDWYWTRKSIVIDPKVGGGASSPAPGHDLEVTRDVSEGFNVAHTVVSWSYPEDSDRNLFWNSRVEIGEFGDLVEFSFQLSFDSAQYLISPVDFDLGRPRIIGSLLQDFRCTCGDMDLSLQPREIEVGQVKEFVSNKLLSRTRRLPIVLVSQSTISEILLIDPHRLADRLAGIAETYYLADKWAGFALTDSVGKTYSCYNGAVRVYWPGFDPAKKPVSQLYLSETVAHAGQRLIGDIFKQFASISAFRYVRGPITTDAIEHLQTQRNRELERLKAAANERGDLNELLDLAIQENVEIQKENAQIRDENGSLKASLRLAHENFRAISVSQEKLEEKALEALELTSGASGPEPKSVEDAVLMARDNFRDTLVIQESALAAASDSPFKQFNKVQQALLAMHEVCLAWRESRKNRISMGGFEGAFDKKGFEYKARESQTAKTRWSNEYETTYKDRRVSIEQHLALGKGGPDTCLRIHFYIDEEQGKFVVAHVGRHKTNTRT
jgi:hypothetical protein